MIKRLAIFMCCALALLMVSCSTESDTVEEYPDWQNRNEAYFKLVSDSAKTAIASGSTEWKYIANYTRNDSVATNWDEYIVVKVLEEGAGEGCPLYTDSVKVHYRGRLLPSTSYQDGYVFDKSFTDDVLDVDVAAPTHFLVSGLIQGMTTALLNMHVGDHWLVYIPYSLAYGTSGTTGIPGYSTLIFEMQLDAYACAGEVLK